MKKYYSFILLFVFIICFSMEGHAESIQLQSPSNGATVNIVNKKIRNWWINYKFGTTQNKKKQGFTSPNPIILKWSKIDGYTYKVFVSNSPKFSRKKTYTSKDNIDVSKIAAQFGGGGHAKAAGASSLKELPDFLLKGEPWTKPQA